MKGVATQQKGGRPLSKRHSPNGVVAMPYAFVWPRLHRLTPYKAPPKFPTPRHRTPAPAARHRCRSSTQKEFFSPVRGGIFPAMRKPLSPLSEHASLLNWLATTTALRCPVPTTNRYHHRRGPARRLQIPTGFRPTAQGCKARATLGVRCATVSTATRLRPRVTRLSSPPCPP